MNRPLDRNAGTDNSKVIEGDDFDNQDVIEYGPEEDTGEDTNVEDWS